VLAVLFLGCWGLVWWQRGEVERVTAEVATLQDQANDLAKRGGKAVLSTCGPQHRLCVRVSPKQFEDGSGIAAPYGGAKGEAWVIIDGY
jgi:hypothetical protein